MSPRLRAALVAWLASYKDAGTTPDPDDLPEEAELYAALEETPEPERTVFSLPDYELAVNLDAANARVAELERLVEACSANFDAMVEMRDERDAATARADAAELRAVLLGEEGVRLQECIDLMRAMMRRWVSTEEIDAELARRGVKTCHP